MFEICEDIDQYTGLAAGMPTGRISKLFSDLNEQVGFGMLYNDNTNPERVIELFTDNYVVVQNGEVLQAYQALAENMFGQGGEVRVAERLGSMWAYFLNKPKKKGAQKNEFRVGVRVANSINGKLRLAAEPFIEKVICGNGATVRMLSEAQKFLHISQRADDIATLLQADLLTDVLDEYVKNYEALRAVTDPDQLDTQIKLLKRKKIFSDAFLKKYQAEWGEIATLQDVYDAATYRGSHRGELQYDDTALLAAEGILLAVTP